MKLWRAKAVDDGDEDDEGYGRQRHKNEKYGEKPGPGVVLESGEDAFGLGPSEKIAHAEADGHVRRPGVRGYEVGGSEDEDEDEDEGEAVL